jgi:hypothetical protein
MRIELQPGPLPVKKKNQKWSKVKILGAIKLNVNDLHVESQWTEPLK